MKWSLALGACVVGCSLTRSGAAEPLDERRSSTYYYAHGGATVSGFLGSLLIESFGAGTGPGYELFPGYVVDEMTRLNFSESAADMSDRALALTVTLPLAAQMSDGFDTSLGNATLIYSQAHAANLLLASAARVLVRRPRPYTHSVFPRVLEYADHIGPEAYRSFYSVHSSVAFTAATTGALLYSARTDDRWARRVMWGVEFTLASLTANLRVTSGREYFSDAGTGGLVGAGVAAGVFLMHDTDVTLDAGEVGIALLTVGVNTFFTQVVSICALIEIAPFCQGSAPDVRVPLTRESDRYTDAVSWVVLPAAFETGGGLQLLGTF